MNNTSTTKADQQAKSRLGATVEKFNRKREVVSFIDEPCVTITMSLEQAQVLRRVLDNIGGDPNGRRGLMQDLSRALIRAGVEADMTVRFNPRPDLDLIGLYFAN